MAGVGKGRRGGTDAFVRAASAGGVERGEKGGEGERERAPRPSCVLGAPRIAAEGTQQV